MQTSVRQLAPRSVGTLTPVSNQIHVSQEVLVTSTQSELPPQKAEGSSTASATALSAMEDGNSHDSRPVRRPSSRLGLTDSAMGIAATHPGHTRTVSKDIARLERDRQDLRELSAFLRTRDPPPENYMSIPDDFPPPKESGSSSLLNIFRRKTKKSKPSPRHLRLPDSAVAAKTISGHWHIAISIPLEHDHPDVPPEPIPAVPHTIVVVPPPQLQSIAPPITVLKPDFSSSAQITPKVAQLPEDNTTPSLNELGPEETDILAEYYREEKLREDALQASPVAASSRGPEVYIPISATATGRPGSQRTDPRHSGGTAYSVRTMDSEHGHSRQVSSVSTVGSSIQTVTPRGLDPPARYSSKVRGPDGSYIEIQPERFPLPPNDLSDEHLIPPAVRYSSLSGASDISDVSSAMVNVADTARGYGPSDHLRSEVRVVRNTPRQPGAAPTRKLPDLPEGSDDGRSITARSSVIQANTGSALSSPTSRSHAGSVNSPQSRQDRVKALRQRDVQAYATKASQSQSDNESPASSPPPAAMLSNVPFLRQGKRSGASGSPSRDPGRRRALNRLSPIIVVADLEPSFTATKRATAVYAPTPLRHSRSTPAQSAAQKAHTPPRSVTPSLASSDEQTIRSPKRETYTPSKAPLQPTIRSAMTDEELEARLSKIERSNAIILQTLNALVAMGAGFQELNRLMPRSLAKAGTEDSPVGLQARKSPEGIDPPGHKREGKA